MIQDGNLIILDTDVLSLVRRDDSPPGMRVRARIAQLPRSRIVFTTMISYHEQTLGWFAYIKKAATKTQRVYAYSLLERNFEEFREARILPYDLPADDVFDELRSKHRHIGTMDLRIASIALSRNALLISRNLQDFTQIHNLRVEDWTR